MQTTLTAAAIYNRVSDIYANDPEGRRLTPAAMAVYMQDTINTMRLKTARAFYGIDEEKIRAFQSANLVAENGQEFVEILVPINEEFSAAFIAAVRERGENINTAGANAPESDRQFQRDGASGS